MSQHARKGAVSVDYVIYLEESNFDIGAMEDPETLMNRLVVHNLLTC